MSIVANRRYHLSGELDRQRARMEEIGQAIVDVARRRTEQLHSLRGKRAFRDLADMQTRLAEAEQEKVRLKARYEDAVSAETSASKRKLARESLLARLQADFLDREAALLSAVLAVAEAKESLYADRDGRLENIATDSGPQFAVHIDGDRSGGISIMEIFCFDYALMDRVTERLGGRGFLIHDSHLFDGVDGRQVETALSLGMSQAGRLGTQYIVAFNSDEFEKLQPEGKSWLTEAVLPVRLDDTDEGGLFGFRF